GRRRPGAGRLQRQSDYPGQSHPSPPAAQTAGSPIRATGTPAIKTLGEPDTMGPPTWGTFPLVFGQPWKSPTLATGLVMAQSLCRDWSGSHCTISTHILRIRLNEGLASESKSRLL